MENEKNKDNSPICVMVAERGIKTSRDFTDFMGALMADVVSGRVEPKIANAACIAGGHMLKMAKLQIDQMGTSESLPLAGNRRSLGGDTQKPE